MSSPSSTGSTDSVHFHLTNLPNWPSTMDSPTIASTLMLRSALSDGTSERKSRKIGTDSKEINTWLKISAADGSDSTQKGELQRKLKSEILTDLRELQKEFDSTSWMFSK